MLPHVRERLVGPSYPASPAAHSVPSRRHSVLLGPQGSPLEAGSLLCASTPHRPSPSFPVVSRLLPISLPGAHGEVSRVPLRNSSASLLPTPQPSSSPPVRKGDLRTCARGGCLGEEVAQLPLGITEIPRSMHLLQVSTF